MMIVIITYNDNNNKLVNTKYDLNTKIQKEIYFVGQKMSTTI